MVSLQRATYDHLATLQLPHLAEELVRELSVELLLPPPTEENLAHALHHHGQLLPGPSRLALQA